MRSWAQEARQDFIAGRLMLTGQVRRRDLIDHFGISWPQASVDFRAFQAVNPGKMRLDTHLKAYVAIQPEAAL